MIIGDVLILLVHSSPQYIRRLLDERYRVFCKQTIVSQKCEVVNNNAHKTDADSWQSKNGLYILFCDPFTNPLYRNRTNYNYFLCIRNAQQHQ